MMIFGKLKEWALYAFVVVSVFTGVFLRGLQKGKESERRKNEELEAKAVETRNRINDEVKNASDSDLDKRASKWMRD